MIEGGSLEQSESFADDMIPDEFSDDEVDGLAYEEVSERFAPRESISSRGGTGRLGTERFTAIKKAPQNVPHGENIQQKEDQDHEYKERESSSVITEIVENKIIYLDSNIDREEVNANKLNVHPGDEDRDKQIEEYLDIDKDEYVNKDEYSDGSENQLLELTEEQQREYEDLEQRKQVLLTRKRELEGIIGDLDRQLDHSMPLENQSSTALENFNVKDITEMKSYLSPSVTVKDVAAAVMICFDAPTDWASFKKFVNHPSVFSSRLVNFDTVNMSEETLERLDDHIETHDLTNIDAISKKSYGAAALAQWVGGISHEAHINQALRPIRERKIETEEMLAQVIYEIEKIEQEQK